MVLAVTAETRPGHSIKARFGDGKLADLAFAVPALADAAERVFNRPQQMSIAAMDLDMQRRFSIGIGLIGKIAHRASGSRRAKSSVGRPGG